MDASQALSFFDSVPYDILALAAFAIVLALDGMRAGIGRSCSLALALPVTLVLFNLIPQTVYVGTLPILSTDTASLAVFGALFVALFLMIQRMTADLDFSGGQPVQALLASLAVASIVVVTWLELPQAHNVWQLSPAFQALFAEGYRLFWLLGSFVVLALSRT